MIEHLVPTDETGSRLEEWLRDAVAHTSDWGPPRLRAALADAVFPGGARLRPRLAIAVARACGADDDATDVIAVATATELFHCASLVHDDLPCFDDADTRRGAPSVHRAHGEEIAVLAGDALLVGGFDALSARASSARLAPLLRLFTTAISGGRGVIAGQAWESEDAPNTLLVHRLKTAALFEAAAVGGAIAAGEDGERFREIGCRFGLAYQLLDDLADRDGDARSMGKPTGKDRDLDRPTAAADAQHRITTVIASVVDAVPDVPGRDGLVTFLDRAWASAAARAGIDVSRSTSSPNRSHRPPLERAG